MRRITKPKPQFKYTTGHPEDLCILYGLRYKGGNQLTESHFSNSVDAIDLDKLDSEEQILTIRGQMLSTQVWLIETQADLDNMFKYTDKAGVFSMDTETSNPARAKYAPDIFVWSIATTTNKAFVIPYHFNQQMLDYLTSTDSRVVMHNAGYDAKLVYLHSKKHITNYEDTMLIAYSYLNDSVLTPSLSLKNLTSNVFGYWSEDVTDLTTDCINRDNLLFYAGVDACATIELYNRYETDRLATPTVDLFDIYPMTKPRDRTYSRYFFYQNVLKQLLPLTYEFAANGIPFDIDKLTILNTTLENTIDGLYAKARNMPTVLELWEKMQTASAKSKSSKYKEERLEIIATGTKSLSENNVEYINKFVEISYPTMIKPSKAKNWSGKVLKTLLGETNEIAIAVATKSLKLLRDNPEFVATFKLTDDYFIDRKQSELTAKCSETTLNMYNRALVDFDFKPFSSSQQKKYILNKAFNIFSSEKTKTGEDSFGRKEIERLLKSEPKGEARDYMQSCVDYSFANIIKTNFIRNVLSGNLNGTMHANMRLGGTKTARPSSGGGSRDLDKGEVGAINLLKY